MDLNNAIKFCINHSLAHVHTAIPGVVESFNGEYASVKPSIKMIYTDGKELELPTILKAPVMFPQTSRGGLTFDIEKGDPVLILFSEKSLEVWLNKGGVCSPGNFRRFDLSDAFVIPGLFSLNNTPELGSGTVLRNGSTTIVMSDSQVNINDGNLTVDIS